MKNWTAGNKKEPGRDSRNQGICKLPTNRDRDGKNLSTGEGTAGIGSMQDVLLYYKERRG